MLSGKLESTAADGRPFGVQGSVTTLKEAYSTWLMLAAMQNGWRPFRALSVPSEPSSQQYKPPKLGVMRRASWKPSAVKALDAIEARTKGIATEIHQQAKGAYLNGEVLDRGTLSIGNEALNFSGWHGTISIPLQHIHHIDTGISSLSPYDGVPILGRLFPGQPRKAFTLLLTIKVPDATVERLVVVADLPDALNGCRKSTPGRAHSARCTPIVRN